MLEFRKRLHHLSLLVCLFCAAGPTLAQFSFVRTFPCDTANLELEALYELRNGDLILSGSKSLAWRHPYVHRTDALGNPIWEAAFAQGALDFRLATARLGGDYFLEGGNTTLDPQLDSDAFLTCYDGTGSLVWSQTIDLAYHDLLTDIATDEKKSLLYVVGRYVEPDSFDRVFVQRLSKNGAVLWQRSFGNLEMNLPTSATTLPNGDLLFSMSIDFVPYLVQVDSGGDVQLQRRMDGLPWNAFDHIAWLSDGRLVATGTDSIVRAFSSDLHLQGELPVGRPIQTILGSTDGGMIVAGPGDSTNRFYLMKWDHEFHPLWTNEYARSLNVFVSQVVASHSGDLLTVGSQYVNALGPIEGFLMRTDCGGNLIYEGDCGAATIEPSEDLMFYPNPFKGIVNFYNKNEDELEVRLYDSKGSLVMETDVGTGTLTLDLALLGNGIYSYSVVGHADNFLKTGKLIKQ